MLSKKSVCVKAAAAIALLCVLSISVVCAVNSVSKNKKNNSEGTEQKTTPSKYANAPTVIIDAGHGGEDGGAVGADGSYEKDINLAIALELEELLRSAGISTRLTRDTDTLLYDKASNYQGHKKIQDAEARLAVASEYDNAIFVSIHVNSFPQSKYNGLQVYYSENSPLSAVLAEKIQSLTVLNLQPDNTRKIKAAGDNIYIMKKLTHPAVLVECGFISNPEECKLLGTAEYRSRLCAVLFAAISDYLENTANKS